MKRSANPTFSKHGIDFVDAMEVFAKGFIESEDLRRYYGERRFRAVGLLGSALVQVAKGRTK